MQDTTRAAITLITFASKANSSFSINEIFDKNLTDCRLVGGYICRSELRCYLSILYTVEQDGPT